MAKKDIHFVVVTPERQVAEGAATSVVIPAHDGELGILPDRAPLMCELGIGQMRYTSGGETHRVFIDGGFAQVNENQVTVLSAHALPVHEIMKDTIQKAEEAVVAVAGNDPETNEERGRAKQRVRVLRALKPPV